MKDLTLKFLLLVFLFSASVRAADPVLAIQDAWVREAPPGATVLAGYLRLDNRGDEAVVINAFRSQDFGRIELHRTVVEQGIARMLPVERLEIPPGESLSLEPGGMHLMLFNPVRPLRQDDRAVFSVELANGTGYQFEALVSRRGTGDESHRHHHHNH